MLEGVAAVAGRGAGDFALGVDDAVPGEVGASGEGLQDAADEAGTARQAGHGGDLAVGGDPAFGDAADDGVDGGGGVGWGDGFAGHGSATVD